MEILKSLKKNTIILLLITMVILVFVLKDDFGSIVKALASMDYKFIFLAIFFFLLSLAIKGYVTYITVNDKKKLTAKEAIKHNFIVQFFNGITPFSTGGQPMEIYMLTEHNIKATDATNITIQNFIFYQTALVIYGILAVAYNAIFHLFPNASILRNLVLIGFFANTLVAVLLFLITFSEKATKKMLHGCLKLLKKIKVLKNYDDKKKELDEKLEEFHRGAKVLRKRKDLLVKGVVLNFISLTCLYIVPLFITFSLHDFNCMNAADTLTASAYVLIMGAFVPIPGASGGIEYAFLQFYGNFIAKKPIKAILIVWRFITYYLGVIMGAAMFSLEKKGD